MMADYYAHLYKDDPKAMDEVEDDDFNPDDVAAIIGAPPMPGADDWEDVK